MLLNKGGKMVKKVNRAQVAQAIGVSESTVSRALNDSPLISEEVKNKVKKKAEELGYFPSRTATLFATGRSYSIGLVVPNFEKILPFTRSYFPSLLDGLLLGATNAGYNVGIVVSGKLGKYRNYIELVNSKSFDGLVFAVSPEHEESSAELIKNHIPFVLVNNYCEGASSVYAKPDIGMEKAFLHAASLGHHDIGYICGDLNYKNGEDRLEIFKQLAAKFNMKSEIVSGDFSYHSGYDGFKKFGSKLGKEIGLVMTSCDRQAFGLIDACHDNGINVPKQLSIIGYDNFVASNPYALTTVDHPITNMGNEAARLLIKMIEKKDYYTEQIWVDTDFVIRNTTSRRLK